jgi:ketosteroid isomerase-like protein
MGGAAESQTAGEPNEDSANDRAELPMDSGQALNAREAAMLRTDGGRLFCFTRVVARKR